MSLLGGIAKGIGGVLGGGKGGGLLGGVLGGGKGGGFLGSILGGGKSGGLLGGIVGKLLDPLGLCGDKEKGDAKEMLGMVKAMIQNMISKFK